MNKLTRSVYFAVCHLLIFLSLCLAGCNSKPNSSSISEGLSPSEILLANFSEYPYLSCEEVTSTLNKDGEEISFTRVWACPAREADYYAVEYYVNKEFVGAAQIDLTDSTLKKFTADSTTASAIGVESKAEATKELKSTYHSYLFEYIGQPQGIDESGKYYIFEDKETQSIYTTWLYTPESEDTAEHFELYQMIADKEDPGLTTLWHVDIFGSDYKLYVMESNKDAENS